MEDKRITSKQCKNYYMIMLMACSKYYITSIHTITSIGLLYMSGLVNTSVIFSKKTSSQVSCAACMGGRGRSGIQIRSYFLFCTPSIMGINKHSSNDGIFNISCIQCASTDMLYSYLSIGYNLWMII